MHQRRTMLDVISVAMYVAIALYHVIIYASEFPYSSMTDRPLYGVTPFIEFSLVMLGLLGVPFFFVRSGYFILSKTPNHFINRALIPLLAVSAFYFLIYGILVWSHLRNDKYLLYFIGFLLFGNQNTHILGIFSPTKLPQYLVWDNWFIYALIPIYALAPLIAGEQRQIPQREATFSILTTYFLLCILPILPTESGAFYPLQSPIGISAFYFLLGLYLFIIRDRLNLVQSRWYLTLSVAMLILMICVAAWLFRIGSPVYLRFRSYANPLLPVVICSLYAWGLTTELTVSNAIKIASEFIAKRGLDIYLSHTLVLFIFLGSRHLHTSRMLPVYQVTLALLIICGATMLATWRKALSTRSISLASALRRATTKKC
jgi:hypothetical protein